MASLIRICELTARGRVCKCEATHRGFKMGDGIIREERGDWFYICAPHATSFVNSNRGWYVEELDG